MGMTIAEKILAAHAGRTAVRPGEYVWCKVDATSGHMLGALERLGVERVWDPERVYLVEDHLAPPPTVEAANAAADLRRLAKNTGSRTASSSAGAGSCISCSLRTA